MAHDIHYHPRMKKLGISEETVNQQANSKSCSSGTCVKGLRCFHLPVLPPAPHFSLLGLVTSLSSALPNTRLLALDPPTFGDSNVIQASLSQIYEMDSLVASVQKFLCCRTGFGSSPQPRRWLHSPSTSVSIMTFKPPPHKKHYLRLKLLECCGILL